MNKSRELSSEIARQKKAIADRDWWAVETNWSISDVSSGRSASESFLREAVVEKELEIRRLNLMLGAGLVEEASNSILGPSPNFFLEAAQPADLKSSVAGVPSLVRPTERVKEPMGSAEFEF